MAVFHYRMQNILDLDYKLEDQQKLVFAQANAALEQEKQRLLVLTGKKEEYEQTLRGEMTAELDVGEIIRIQEGIATLRWHMGEQQNRIRRCEERLEEERLRLTEAMRERKMQEKLREHDFDEFRMEEEAAERKIIDELVAYRYGNTSDRKDGMDASELL